MKKSNYLIYLNILILFLTNLICQDIESECLTQFPESNIYKYYMTDDEYNALMNGYYEQHRTTITIAVHMVISDDWVENEDSIQHYKEIVISAINIATDHYEEFTSISLNWNDIVYDIPNDPCPDSNYTYYEPYDLCIDYFMNEFNHRDTLDIYFSSYIDSSSSLCGYGYVLQDALWVRYRCADNLSTLTHEIGHVMGLFHTHNEQADDENVERIVNQPCYNCEEAGDYLCDTEADPWLNTPDGYIVDNSCHYTGVETDNCGIHYDEYTPLNELTHNFMSYSIPACRETFSLQQAGIMHYFSSTIWGEGNENIVYVKFRPFDVNNGQTISGRMKIENEDINWGFRIIQDPKKIPLLEDSIFDVSTLSLTPYNNDDIEFYEDYKHIYWRTGGTEHPEEYSKTYYNISIDWVFEYDGIEAGYQKQYPAIFTINENLTFNNIDFHDPWWVDPATNMQPDEFRPLIEQIEVNEMKVFRDIINYGNPLLPVYKIRSPQYIIVEGELYEFAGYNSPSNNIVIISDEPSLSNLADLVFMTPSTLSQPNDLQINFSLVSDEIVFNEDWIIDTYNYTIPAFTQITLNADLIVQEGSTLIIEEGVQINFSENSSIIVNGSLIIHGEAENEVQLNSVASWGGIDVISGSAEIDHTIISHANSAIMFNGNTSGFVQNSEIYGNNKGIVVESSDVNISNNNIHDNNFMGILSYFENPMINLNQIHHNHLYGIALLFGSHARLNYNEIYANGIPGNQGRTYGGLVIINSAPELFMTLDDYTQYPEYPVNNSIFNNSSRGVLIGYNGTPNLGFYDDSPNISGGFNHFYGNEVSVDRLPTPDPVRIPAQWNYWHTNLFVNLSPNDISGEGIMWDPVAESINGNNEILLGSAIKEEQRGNTQSALILYNVFIDLYPASEFILTALDGLCRCYEKTGQKTQQIFRLTELANQAENTILIQIANDHLAWSYRKADLDVEAIEQAESLISEFAGTEYEAIYLLELALLISESDGSILGRENPNNQITNIKSKLLSDFPEEPATELFTAIFGSEFVNTSQTNSIPQNFKLFPVYPNPFNPNTTIQFSLPVHASVNLTVYDLKGRMVVELLNGKMTAGFHQSIWNAEEIAAGLYLIRMNISTDNKAEFLYSAVQKVILLK